MKITEINVGAETPQTFIDITNPYFTNDPDGTLKCAKPNVDLKETPSSEAKTIITLQSNERIEYIGYINAQAIEPQSPVWYYVKYTNSDNNEKFGYIYAKYTTIPTLKFTKHPLSETEDGVNNGNNGIGDTTVVRNNLLETLLAIGIAIPAIILIILVFKPRGDSKRNKNRKNTPPPTRRPRQDEYYEDEQEDDYDNGRDRRPPPKGRQNGKRNRY